MKANSTRSGALRKITLEFEFRHLSLLAAISIFSVIVLGTAVSAGQGTGCPDWPTCYGAFTPPGSSSALLEYAHRLATALAVPLLAAAVWWAARRKQDHRLILRSHAASLFAMLVLSLLSAIPFLRNTEWAGSLHLALALVSLSLVLVGTTAAYLQAHGNLIHNRLNWKTPFGRLVLETSTLTFMLLVSGSLVAATGATNACSGWPLCDGQLFPSSSLGWMNMAHRLLVLLTAILIFWLLLQAWRTQRSQVAVLVSATAGAVLFISQGLMGAVNVAQGYPEHLVALHSATSAAIWVTLTLLLTLTGLSSHSAQDEELESQEIVGRRPGELLKDFLMLTKPIVVALLLVTTFAGMIIGAKSWPAARLIFWTLLGGFLAAGGSGAINQYIDREDDIRMQRTSRRPIPAGRLTPAEGLAFGVAISLASFYLMVAFVNFLAALLSLAGIIYYVVLYSLLLKKTTVQNIVIGGGAGAIPPLVGWAAATGALTFPSLLLFAVIFMWTPPHFWALAIVRRKDYARAGVPMLPVVRGEKETRWQVFLYTMELVALTLILPVFGLGSSIYLVAAIVLGGMLLGSAYQVWKKEGNKIAWKMYRYSSMYLAFLFLALMIDRLLL
jgi:protoheme IX farnesyltransferase